jgi:hypothetical protein
MDGSISVKKPWMLKIIRIEACNIWVLGLVYTIATFDLPVQGFALSSAQNGEVADNA